MFQITTTTTSPCSRWRQGPSLRAGIAQRVRRRVSKQVTSLQVKLEKREAVEAAAAVRQQRWENSAPTCDHCFTKTTHSREGGFAYVCDCGKTSYRGLGFQF